MRAILRYRFDVLHSPKSSPRSPSLCKCAPPALAMTVEPIGPPPNRKGKYAGVDFNSVAVERPRAIERLEITWSHREDGVYCDAVNEGVDAQIQVVLRAGDGGAQVGVG